MSTCSGNVFLSRNATTVHPLYGHSAPTSLHEVPDIDNGAKTIEVPCLLPHEIFDAVWRAGSRQDRFCSKLHSESLTYNDSRCRHVTPAVSTIDDWSPK